MKNKVKTIVKTTILIIFILLLTILIYSKMTKQKVFALTAGEATQQSHNYPIKDKEWREKRSLLGDDVIVASYEPDGTYEPAKSLRDVLPTETINGEDYVVVTAGDLHRIKSLFCCAKGRALSTGYFQLVETRQCTPQEAWVLAE